jgi:heterodisulfide reductase subunit C
MIKTGLKERLLSSPTLWHCTHCDTCLFVCPQNVRFSSVVDVLREMAINRYLLEGRKSGERPPARPAARPISVSRVLWAQWPRGGTKRG